MIHNLGSGVLDGARSVVFPGEPPCQASLWHAIGLNSLKMFSGQSRLMWTC